MVRAISELRTSLFALEQIGIKLGLDQIRTLVTELDRPDLAFPSLIVAGTNGKGSVTAMLERGLRAAGYRTGRYTSPHLVDLEERFAIDGESVAPAMLDLALSHVFAAAERLEAPPTFFEATTAAALDIFRDARIDVAVLEVGLGGRLDATNVVTATGAAITAVDFDHEQYLGHTLTDIAREKAGVIKPNMQVVLADNPPAVEAVVAEACLAADARLVRATDGVDVEVEMQDGRATVAITTPVRRYSGVPLGLRGRHQVQNAVTAVRLLEELAAAGKFAIGASAIETGLTDVVWPGRLERFRRGAVELLIDGAHNPAGAAALAAHVRETYGRRLPMVVGVMKDKNIEALLGALAPAAAAFVFTSATSPRAASPADLLDVARRVAPDIPMAAVNDPIAAVERAAAAGSPVVVAGSLFLAGDIRSRWA